MAGGAVFGTDMLGKFARALMMRNQQQKQAPTWIGEEPPSMVPPPAQPVDQSMPVMPPVTVTAQAPQAAQAPQMPQQAPVAPPMPEPVPVGMDAKPDVLLALKQMQAQGRLPEQWKGAFSPGYGEPV